MALMAVPVIGVTDWRSCTASSVQIGDSKAREMDS
jgi:hypothetical protein